MRTRRLLVAALLAAPLLAPRLAAGAEPERARNSPCTGIYTGSARGVFWCSVVAQHDERTNRTTFRIETEDDIQMSGDALTITPGTMEFTGAPAVGVLQGSAAGVSAAWSALRTGVPPTEADYGAARAAPKVAPDQGSITLDLATAEPGPKAGGAQVYAVHGTFTARLLPLPNARAVGEVRITVRF
jgi:hypothetical protein